MIEALDITPDGQRVISVSDPDTIKVWNLFTKKEELTIQDSDRSLFLWADYMVYELLRNRPIVLSHPDNKKIIIATKSGNNSIEIYNITTGKKELTLKGHTDCITAIALAFNSEKLVSASQDKTLKVWDLNTGVEIFTLFGHNAPVTTVAVASNNRIISSSQDKTLKGWDLVTGKEVFTLVGHTGSVTTFAITPDGERIISGSEDNTIKIWDLKLRKELKTIKGHREAVIKLNIIFNGQFIVSASADNTIKIWDVLNAREIMTFTGDSPISCSAVSPDEKTIIVGDRSGQVHFLRLEGLNLRVESSH